MEDIATYADPAVPPAPSLAAPLGVRAADHGRRLIARIEALDAQAEPSRQVGFGVEANQG